MTDQTYPTPARFMSRTACLLLLGMLAACGPRVAHPVGTPFDPFEAENRRMHAFNKSLDTAVVRPVAMGYTAVMPDDLETLVQRFDFHVSIPGSVVNSILQGNMRAATQDIYRFAVNSTLGLGGLFDPATDLNMPPAADADFGQTLHVWGVPAGAYVELPVIGPSTERDATGRFVDLFLDPLSVVLPGSGQSTLTGVWVTARVGERGQFAGTIDSLLYESADSYAQSRSLFLQNRNFELGGTGGEPYLDPYDDPYDQ